ncbi:MAG TPA: SpoIVB peptidase [Lachnospiraceae bacterium]|nr:SpoIVB peptidase [Lachnospiraceae bacterium]
MREIEKVQNIKKIYRRRKTYRKCLCFSLLLTCMSLFGIWYIYMYQQIPGNIKLKMGEEQVLNIGLPVAGEIVKIEENAEKIQAVTANGQGKSNIPAGSVYVDFSNTVTMKADKISNYQMNLKLFGFIPFKQVSIEVIRDMTLTPVGLPIGIYLKTEGVLVIGVGNFLSLDGSDVSPSQYLLKTGDYILEVDHIEVSGKREFIHTIEQSDGNPVVLTVSRNGEEFDVSITPDLNQNGIPKLGIWVRDNAQGIGTMTFVDNEGNFGALGHGINDIDTSIVMNLDSGTLYQTEIIGIKKGTKGEPGEMTGMIEYSDRNILGIINENTVNGIFGTCNERMLSQIETEPIPIGLKQDVELGDAQIICSVDGKPKYYDIKIKELHLEHDNVNKGIVLQVTDPNLIAITGGIIQGMSGAPIIQNGKLIGAVTHVLVSDSTSGYGIFIENMLKQ